ncbi:hypothetical protein LR48_Vigan09g249800 [Vigna angularis]|uniref:F-box domain-containing protein n=2 Tax=Phaseolus angularis TaxID=3914 RepID=A0A0S3S2G2_PHAAN|nr:putative FBD-associated F-box protein At1g61330 isoform X1 [Vigna angularis]KAG2396121.1 putative FBD-associated F-box protein [Vigna angularis]KOM53839.1 hypothetical protein LR48_Vigan09g249800 [Vigna angularis]BAT87020.1 hypothetical protein VIGAN_05035700 [Vigna angularis var. angularis]
MAKIRTHCGSKRLRIVSQPQTLSPSIFQHLPFEIVEEILSFLPIKEAKQLCILSSKFRSPTHISRKFLFGRDLTKRCSREFIVELVDHLFVTHRGRCIDSFQIYINPVGVENFLHKWLEICREKRIQELELVFYEPGYTLTADFLSQLYKLSSLKLVHCKLELPLNLLSMANLRILILRFVPLTDEGIHALISNCRQLETVDLLYCTGLLCVEIYAREHRFFKKLRVAGCKNLEVFVVDSPIIECVHYCGHVPTRIRFIQATQLNEVYLNFMPAGSRGYLQASVLEKLVSDIPNVKILSASALVPEALTAKFRRGVFGEACYSFLNLMELHLIMEGGLFCNPYDILSFMKHCPLVEKLFIDIDDYTFDCGPYWELHQKSKMENFDLYFVRLNFIKLRGFKFIAAELQLVKILLQKATHLDALVLVSQKNCLANIWTPYGRRYDKLLNSWKASPEAKIVTFEHLDDRTRPSASRSREALLSMD